MPQPTNGRRRTLCLILILLLGLGIRLTGLLWGQGYCSIGPSDALEAYSVTVDYASGEPKADYLGQPNFNAHAKLPGPLWTLFCFVGLRSWGSIEGVVLEIILVNTAAIYLTYLLAERTLSPSASLWAALFAATLPFAVYYSVSIYNPNVMPFLGGLLFLALWDVIRRPRSRSIFWVVLLLLITPHFHMCVTMLLPAAGLILWLAAARLNLPWLLSGVAVGALAYVPYLRGEMAHGWSNTIGMMHARGGYGWGALKALTAPLNLLLNWVPQWAEAPGAYRHLGIACFGWFGILLVLNLISALAALLLLAGVSSELRAAARGFWRAPRQAFNRSPGILFLALVVGVPLAFAAASGKNFRTHYAIGLFPPLLALAGGAAAKWSCSPRFGRLAVAILAVVTCGNIWFMPAMFHDQRKRIEKGDEFIPSFRNLEAVYQRLKAHAGAEHRVTVDDSAYLHGLPRPGDFCWDAKLIRLYVATREKETSLSSNPQRSAVTYAVCPAAHLRPHDPAAAYVTRSFALLAIPPGGSAR